MSAGGRPPPANERELMDRANSLAGRTLSELAAQLGEAAPTSGLRGKGKPGELIERLLGAQAGSRAAPDFLDLGVELKTLPLDARGRVRESTYVCRLNLREAEHADWEDAWVRRKLARVLWVPVIGRGAAAVVGEPLLWSPSSEQERLLRDDFEELTGQIGLGGIESLSAHMGFVLQLRPKAATGRVRTVAFGREGERIPTVPRGFYLRTRFTQALLVDPRGVPARVTKEAEVAPRG